MGKYWAFMAKAFEYQVFISLKKCLWEWYILPKCMFVYPMHAWWPKRVSEPLELEL